MLINTLDVAAASGHAAFAGVRSPRASLYVAGMDLVSARTPVLAAGNPDARFLAFRPTPAMMAQLAAVAAALPTATDIRKHVHKTRTGAGGYGAMGPHPEREPA